MIFTSGVTEANNTVLFWHGVFQNNLYVQDSLMKWYLQDPSRKTFDVWNAMLNTIKNPIDRIILTNVYEVTKMPPYGIKDGSIQLFVVAMISMHKDSIALYEHGTFVPRLKPEFTERMTKYPEHFELKYFKRTFTKKALLKHVIEDLGIISNGGVLDVVSYLIRIVSALLPQDNWKNNQRNMFKNNLRMISAKFKRITRIHFTKISNNLIKPSCKIIITLTNDSEQHNRGYAY